MTISTRFIVVVTSSFPTVDTHQIVIFVLSSNRAGFKHLANSLERRRQLELLIQESNAIVYSVPPLDWGDDIDGCFIDSQEKESQSINKAIISNAQ